MSLTKSAGSSNVSRTFPVEQPALSHGLAGGPDMLAGWFNQHGIQLDHNELSGLFRFETFLCHHVVPAQKGDVQCMLLWNEWVRIFRRQESRFPALIREKEFRTAILDRYDAVVSTDGARGQVYCGIRFVP